jgi:excisionase family DNA binding protein
MTEENKGEMPAEGFGEGLRAAPSGDFPEVMTVRQAAEYLQVNEQVLYRYVREGKVPVAKMGATIRFKRSVIDAWLARESWESIGASVDASGEVRQGPAPSRPKMPMELD